jgi:1-acyl-sn-glycerol-3-phosphate acyltransferase
MHLHRLLTVPGYTVAWSLWLGLMPAWLVLAALVDLVRQRRFIALRSAAFLTVYLTCEVLGLVASAWLWTRRKAVGIEEHQWMDLHFRLEAWWGTTLFRAVTFLFGLRVEIENDADLGSGPYLLFIRHASAGDTLLASTLISHKYSMNLRYVLKQELLWDPCLDVVGNRLPNVFVNRHSDDSETEVQRVRKLANDLGPRDGVLIYPEGTRYSESKRRRVLARLDEKGDSKMLEYTKSLQFVLPPRYGGVLGLLEAAPEADVVVCAHTGFEAVGSLDKFWKGDLVHQVIHIQFRRHRRNAIPVGNDGRITWLQEEWRRVNAWVGDHQ